MRTHHVSIIVTLFRGNFHKQNKWRIYNIQTYHNWINQISNHPSNHQWSQIKRWFWWFCDINVDYMACSRIILHKLSPNETKPIWTELNQNKFKEQRQQLRKHRPWAIFRRRYRIITLKTVWNETHNLKSTFDEKEMFPQTKLNKNRIYFAGWSNKLFYLCYQNGWFN